MTIARQVFELLQQHNAGGIKVLMGGIIPEGEARQLLELGVAEVFTPKDSNLGEIVRRIAAICGEQVEDNQSNQL